MRSVRDAFEQVHKSAHFNAFHVLTSMHSTSYIRNGIETDIGDGAASKNDEIRMLRSEIETLRRSLCTASSKRVSDLEEEMETLKSNDVFSGHGDEREQRKSIVEAKLKKRRLPQDTFSYILASSAKTFPFLFAFFVYVFQILTFSLLMVDLVQSGDGASNPFGIPGNVDSQVRATQFLAINIAVFTQQDLLTGFGLFRDGYAAEIQSAFPHSAPWKFAAQLLARLSEGSLGLIVSFLLIGKCCLCAQSRDTSTVRH